MAGVIQPDVTVIEDRLPGNLGRTLMSGLDGSARGIIDTDVNAGSGRSALAGAYEDDAFRLSLEAVDGLLITVNPSERGTSMRDILRQTARKRDRLAGLA